MSIEIETTMDMDKILSMSRVISRHQDLAMDDDLKLKCGLTSMSLVLLLTELYDEFKLDISMVSEREFFGLKSLSDIVAMMQNHVRSSGATNVLL